MTNWSKISQKNIEQSIRTFCFKTKKGAEKDFSSIAIGILNSLFYHPLTVRPISFKLTSIIESNQEVSKKGGKLMLKNQP